MRTRRTEHSTRVLRLKGGTEDNDLWIYDMKDDVEGSVYGDNIVCSVWVPSPEEREAIANGENIRLMVWGTNQPPVAMDTTDEKLMGVDRAG